jgi:hypothetical protein
MLTEISKAQIVFCDFFIGKRKNKVGWLIGCLVAAL